MLSYKCSTSVGLSVAVAATVYQESHFRTRLRTEGQELFAFLFLTQKYFFSPFQHMIHDLIQHKNSIPEIYGWI